MHANLGFSTVCFDSISHDLRLKLLDSFQFFDVPLKQVGSFEREIMSVQSLVDRSSHPDVSLVGEKIAFNELREYFVGLAGVLSNQGISSAILGSPFLRENVTVSLSVIEERLHNLIEIFSVRGIHLYLEALPEKYSAVFNLHSDLFQLHTNLDFGIHVDLATTIDCGEEFDLFYRNIERIDRFHFSVPGYSSNFSEFEVANRLLKTFLNRGIKGTIEIQDFREFNLEKFFQQIQLSCGIN